MKATKPAAIKKTPVGRKPAAVKAAPDSSTEESGSASKREQSSVDGTNTQTDVSMVTLETTRPLPIKKKIVRRVVKVVKKTPANAKVLLEQTPKTVVAAKSKVEEREKEDELAAENVGESIKKEGVAMGVEESKVDSVAVSVEEESVEEPVVDSRKEDEAVNDRVGEPVKRERAAVDIPADEVGEVSKNEEPDRVGKGVKEDERKDVDNEVEAKNEAVKMEGSMKDQVRREEIQHEQDEYGGDGYEEYGDRVDFEDPVEDDFEDPDEPVEEADAMEEERRELTAVAKERKIKKEYEIFVGGLDRDATEEDLRKVFEKIGEVVEIRLHKNLSTNRNKGYAFVKFANKGHVKRALSEMKNPVIRGKRCGTAPSEDNDTLFLGNICNTWTKEAIRQKLKDYGVEGVENITAVPDAQHEGRSRGFAFLEFACHADAMLAYKRLQKPDVVFGHPDRTAKVAFSEPIREPDPEIMAQVKTIFLDGLPPQWDEDHVRECVKGYGEIVRIVLARNMSTAKRKDFGFVDFSTHEAAVACIEGINNREFGNGNTKMRVKANTENTENLSLDSIGKLCSASQSLRAPFHSLVSEIAAKQGHPPLCIISDVFFGWANEVANSLGTVNITFSTGGAYGTLAYSSLWLNLPHRGKSDSDEFHLPGFPDRCRFHITQLHHFLRNADGTDSWSKFFQSQISLSLQSAGWLCNTVEEFEPAGLEWLRNFLKLPVWAIGPLLPPTLLKKDYSSLSVVASGLSTGRAGKRLEISVERCMEWLESHSPASVLYISFGSQNSISPSQMMELAIGLEESEKPFIWVIRPPVGFDKKCEFRAECLPEGFEERMEKRKQGLLVSNWAPQLEILSHESTGAFLSHCGWNSVLESLSQAVPIIGWPLAAEQAYNSKMLVEEMGVSVELTRGLQSRIDWKEVKKVIELVMDKNGKGGDMRSKAVVIKDQLRAAVRDEGEDRGSSVRALDDLIKTLQSKWQMSSIS